MHPNSLQKILDRYFGMPFCLLLGGFKSHNHHGASHFHAPSFPPKRILLIQLSAIGDTILAIPTIRAIRHRFPHAHLAMVASSLNLQYLEHCPYIDQRIPCRLEDLIRSPRRLAQFFISLRSQKFDWTIDFEHWPRFSAVVAYGSGAPRRIGFRTANQYRHYPFTDVVDHTSSRHEVINFLEIAKLLDCPIKGTYLEVWPGEEDWNWATNFLQEVGMSASQPIVAFHPEAGRRGKPRKRWPHDRIVEVADMLVDRYRAQIVLTGAPSEVELSQRIASQMQFPCGVAAGQTSLNQLAALFSNSDLVICSDCGPMHVAAATGTSVIALHGPTTPLQWGPWTANHTVIKVNLPCSPCLNLGFEYGCEALTDGTSPCMHTLQVREVLKACEKYL